LAAVKYLLSKGQREDLAKLATFGKQEMARQQAKKTVRPERDTAVATGKKGDLGDLAPTPDAAKPAAFGVLVRKGTSYD